MPIINQVVKGGGGGSFVGVPKTIDANGKLQNGTTVLDFNGITDVGDYVLAYAYYKSNISGAVSINSITKLSGEYGMRQFFMQNSGITSFSMPNLTVISGNSALNDVLNKVTTVTSISFPSLTTVSGSSAFSGAFLECTNLISGDFSNLETVSGGNAFNNAFNKISPTVLDWFPKLKTISGGQSFSFAFRYSTCTLAKFNVLETISGSNGFGGALADCLNLTTCELDLLKEVTGSGGLGSTFARDTSLTTIMFKSLSNLTGSKALENMCNSCSNVVLWFYALTPTSFGNYTNCFYQMFRNGSNNTVHFPIAIQSTIGSWSDVTNGFSGTNTTVLYDLVTSLVGADTNTYTRSEKDSTATATAWKYNDVLYYTSGVSNNTAGVNEPSVGDTIYSDSACTTAVTTISAIA